MVALPVIVIYLWIESVHVRIAPLLRTCHGGRSSPASCQDLGTVEALYVVGHSGLSCLRVRRDRRYEDLAVLLGSPYQRADVVSRLKETSPRSLYLVAVQDLFRVCCLSYAIQSGGLIHLCVFDAWGSRRCRGSGTGA